MPLLRLVALSLISACVRAFWHGISPELERKLSTVSSFTCDNEPQQLDVSRLNDNYCDCADGSDEPGTSACSHTSAVFHCVNAGFFSTNIPTSLVNDGICDCCDGSDEYASGVLCTHECVHKMKAFEWDKKEVLEQFEAGLYDRVTLVTEAQKLIKEEDEKLKTLETSVESLKIKVEHLEGRKIEDERLENDEKMKRVSTGRNAILSELGLLELTQEQLLSIILEIGRTGLTNKHDLLPIIRKEREAAAEEEKDVRNTVMEDKYEAFRERDAARLEEARRVQALMDERELKASIESGKLEETKEEARLEQADEEVLTLPEVELHPMDVLYDELGASERYEWVRAVFTRQDLVKIETQLNEEKEKLSKTQQLLGKHYGDDFVFFALRNKCVETATGQYKYKVCFYGTATQDSTKLGHMDDLELAVAEGQVGTSGKEIKFVNGDKCWNGPKRSLAVELQCGPDPMELFEMEEPSTCVYTAKLRTPAVCRQEDRKRIMSMNNAVVAPHHIEIEVHPTM